MRHLRSKSALACTLALTVTLLCGIKPAARATLIPASAAAGVQSTSRASDMKAVQGALESKLLRQRLSEHGLSEAEIDARLARLSDRQLHQFATRLNAVNPGGDFSVVGILLVIVLVLFILYLVKRV
ncbi:MAG: PA2779 family protein [Elusimicrobia bacterium]|nr:PA2779 family protein [Elusimicrobiota bacterium]